jgi:hypothetical protein
MDISIRSIVIQISYVLITRFGEGSQVIDYSWGVGLGFLIGYIKFRSATHILRISTPDQKL